VALAADQSVVQVFTWRKPCREAGKVTYQDRHSTFNNSVRDAIRRGAAENEVQKQEEKITGVPMQQYFELVDCHGLKLPSAERRQQDSLKSCERSVEVWKDWIRLRKNSQHLAKSCLQRNCHQPSARDRVHIQQRETSKEEFGRRALAGGNI